MTAGLANQLIVPITLWGNEAPTHCISAIYISNDQKTLATGTNDGHVCIWDLERPTGPGETWSHSSLTPRCMLFGHTAPVLCLVNGSLAIDNNILVSSSEAGEMCTWDITDGRCIESVRLQYVHTKIQPYVMIGQDESRLFCNGYYAEILIISSQTLEILFTLTSRLNPDWITAMHVIRPPKRQDDVVIGLSVSGVVKVWTLAGNETRSSEPIYENESKPIRCLNPVKLVCCAFNLRTVLVVCGKYWQIYDAGDFSLLSSIEAKRGKRWSGGDFISADRVCISSDVGLTYLYKLPSNLLKGKSISCNPESKDFHAKQNDSNQPLLYSKLQLKNDPRLLCPPVTAYSMCIRNTSSSSMEMFKILIRGDSLGRISIWNIPDITNDELKQVKEPSVNEPNYVYSLKNSWESMKPLPSGIFDHFVASERKVKITASVYLPLQGRLVCGREDGSIIMISATRTIMLQLLTLKKRHSFDDFSQFQILEGHAGRITCLLYPHHVHQRYDIQFLLSGGVDFSVCLWDIYSGALLHRFSVHAGEISQLLVPPKDCSSRVQQCICSVGSDHSVALLSLKERKCVMLASRHLFPINVIKWRPLDDFLIVGCSDGSVYVWQMETGHLDRVVQGIVAEEILSACDETSTAVLGDKMSNPAVHLFRGLRAKNLAAIKQAAVRGLHQIGLNQHQEARDVVDHSVQARSHPLMIQGLKANPKDQDSHVLFFDIESIIVNLLNDEYSLLSPGSLESQGLTTNAEFQRFLSMSCSPETQHKLSGLFAKVKESSGSAFEKIQARAEKVGFKPGSAAAEITLGSRKPSSASLASGVESAGQSPIGTPTLPKKQKLQLGESNLTMEIAQIILSLLHAWGLDSDLDKLCESKLGLLKPLRPVCFGQLSKAGHMSLLLPMTIARLDAKEVQEISKKQQQKKQSSIEKMSYGNTGAKHVRLAADDDLQITEKLLEEARARRFVSRIHWELSTAMTTGHLLSIISLANTLMSMSSATFILEQEKKRKLIRRLSRADSKVGEVDLCEGLKSTIGLDTEQLQYEQQQVKQGWSLLAALHCVLLPDLLKMTQFKKPLVEVLARRWQDRCIEVREASQALLLAELRRIGSKGRKALVDEWSPFLPQYADAGNIMSSAAPYSSYQSYTGGSSNPHSVASSTGPSPATSEVNIKDHLRQHQRDKDGDTHHEMGSDEDFEELDPDHDSTGGGGADGSSPSRRPSATTADGRRKQTTAIILLGVIGSEYGNEIETTSKSKADHMRVDVSADVRKRSIVEGFGGAGNYSLSRQTAHALAYLLLVKPSKTLPLHTSLRRAAIDLIGRGFTVWEPYLDVSKVLLGLLELCTATDKIIPTMSFGLPLTPAADSCRTAKHAISLIATVRPQAFITTLAREVARYNSVQQNPNQMNVNIYNTVLSKAKPEILRNIELLIEKSTPDVSDLIIETMDIVIHCLDINHLKTKSLSEVFPAVIKFPNVSYCPATKRIAVGANNGQLAIYELKTPQKSQLIMAHARGITAVSFSPDGKHLSSYSMEENKICFWSTATSLFGLGNAQTKCIRTYSTPIVPNATAVISMQNPTGSKPIVPRLVWIANKSLILMFSDGTEHRFNV